MKDKQTRDTFLDIPFSFLAQFNWVGQAGLFLIAVATYNLWVFLLQVIFGSLSHAQISYAVGLNLGHLVAGSLFLFSSLICDRFNSSNKEIDNE